MCDFCCLVDFEFCSRDIGICEPVTDRHLDIIVDCVLILGGIIGGFPVIIRICGCLMTYRCCPAYFVNTGGVTCYELLARVTCFMFCIKFNQIYKKKDDDLEEEGGGGGKRGLLFKMFYYMFCCFLFPCLFKKDNSASAAAPGGEVELGEDGEPIVKGEGEEGEPEAAEAE